MRTAALSFCVSALLVSSPVAAGGPPHPDTIARLQQRITLEQREIPMAEFIEIVSQKTGLSFVVSMDIAHMPEPLMLVANNITVGDLLKAAAFALHLESSITPEGIVSFRFHREDPRLKIALGRYEDVIAERRRDELRERKAHMRRKGGERPEMPEAEALEIANKHPGIVKMRNGWGAFLVPRKFIPERGAWNLEIRKTEDGPPVGMAIVYPEGNVDIKMHDFGAKERAPGQRKKRKKDRLPDAGGMDPEEERPEFPDRGDEELERF
jgi:hypothetical protein